MNKRKSSKTAKLVPGSEILQFASEPLTFPEILKRAGPKREGIVCGELLRLRREKKVVLIGVDEDGHEASYEWRTKRFNPPELVPARIVDSRVKDIRLTVAALRSLGSNPTERRIS